VTPTPEEVAADPTERYIMRWSCAPEFRAIALRIHRLPEPLRERVDLQFNKQHRALQWGEDGHPLPYDETRMAQRSAWHALICLTSRYSATLPEFSRPDVVAEANAIIDQCESDE
jgi:hypothetical protein